MERRLAAILCGDIEGFSRLAASAEEPTLKRLDEHGRKIIQPMVGKFNGRLFKTMGDGILAEFPSAVDAVRCALAIQNEVACSEAEVPEGRHLKWRLAVHLGDVVVESGDLFGDGVNIAARLQSMAPPGGVLVSRSIGDQIQSNFEIRPLGSRLLKNMPRAIDVFEVTGPSGGVEGRRLSAGNAWPHRSAALVLALFAILAVSVWWQADALQEPLRHWLPGKGGPTASVSGPPRILVLPIAADESDRRADLLADGVTDEIIGRLSRFDKIRVLGRNTSAALGKLGGEPSLLRQHDIVYVVNGRIQTAADRFRLNLELVDVATGETRWSQRYERDLSNTFEVFDAVVTSIVGTIAVRVSSAELDRSRQRPPSNLSAFELMLQGRRLWQRPSKENIEGAQQLLFEAIEADPDYPPPYAYAAFTFLTSYNHKWSPYYEDPAALHRMAELAAAALELNPNYATADAAQAIAYTYLGRHDDAEAAAMRAFDSNSSDPDVLGRVAQVLSFSGQHQRAIEVLNTALELDPMGPAQWFNFLSRAHFFSGDEDRAVTAARTCLERANVQPCKETLAAALALAGQLEEAGRLWIDLSDNSPEVSPEKLVQRLRPAFRRQSDLDRLVEGLSRAAAVAGQS